MLSARLEANNPLTCLCRNKRFFMTPLDFTIPEKGQLTRLADDLYWAQFALPFRLNHINLYMIDTPEGWVLIDAGLGDDMTRDHWQDLLNGPLTHQPVAKIIISHHHVDHMGNAGWLEEVTGADVFASAGEIKQTEWLFNLPEEEFTVIMAEAYLHYGLPEDAVDHVRQGGSRFRRLVPSLPRFNVITPGEVIKSRHGAWHIRSDQGHSHDHLSFMDHRRGLYIAVDFLLPRISPNIAADISNIDADHLAQYFTYLKEMSALDNDVQVFPGHDWPFKDGGKRAQALIDHHHQRLELLRAALREKPLTTDGAMAVLFGRAFDAHELYFASGEARAHLIHLVARGEAEMQRQDGQPDLFVSTD